MHQFAYFTPKNMTEFLLSLIGWKRVCGIKSWTSRDLNPGPSAGPTTQLLSQVRSRRHTTRPHALGLLPKRPTNAYMYKPFDSTARHAPPHAGHGVQQSRWENSVHLSRCAMCECFLRVTTFINVLFALHVCVDHTGPCPS